MDREEDGELVEIRPKMAIGIMGFCYTAMCRTYVAVGANVMIRWLWVLMPHFLAAFQSDGIYRHGSLSAFPVNRML